MMLRHPGELLKAQSGGVVFKLTTSAGASPILVNVKGFGKDGEEKMKNFLVARATTVVRLSLLS